MPTRPRKPNLKPQQDSGAPAKPRRHWTHRAVTDLRTHAKIYVLYIGLFLSSYTDIWLAIGDEIASHTDLPPEVPKWLNWGVRGVAIVVGVTHRVRKDR